jgi:hypothetical protein
VDELDVRWETWKMKDNPITREELAWMITRCAGVTFALLAIITIIPAINTFVSIKLDFPKRDQYYPELKVLWSLANTLVFTGVLCGFTSYIFLRYGSSFKWLIHRGDARQQADFFSGSDSKTEKQNSADTW